ncbi:glyoxalase [Bifidobacterium leontopitheci]|uniref:Glyoxalase n=2 Tax=Bifidobacterium leontopitheci TaxID=2650774 RepID=A0A6I1GGM4_9BIFI|nr:VOC family protein [Bifidobacterium leontopitheci]KAB7789842.1 glyoxalase [Bifidobacterium leontopitheci]
MAVMTEFTTDLQHSGMVSKDLDATIDYYVNKIGFKLVGRYPFGNNQHVAFLRYGHLTIETWDGEEAPMKAGAINHWAFDVPDVEAAFENAKKLGLNLKDKEIQEIPTFWEHGIRYFNVIGINGETLEFCQILKK